MHIYPPLSFLFFLKKAHTCCVPHGSLCLSLLRNGLLVMRTAFSKLSSLIPSLFILFWTFCPQLHVVLGHKYQIEQDFITHMHIPGPLVLCMFLDVSVGIVIGCLNSIV